jgi:site-specific recombinase XerD
VDVTISTSPVLQRIATGAIHLFENGRNILTVQDLLGQLDVTTSTIYTHVLNRGPSGVRGPFDATLDG